jgi:hypothetical protein
MCEKAKKLRPLPAMPNIICTFARNYHNQNQQDNEKDMDDAPGHDAFGTVGTGQYLGTL